MTVIHTNYAANQMTAEMNYKEAVQLVEATWRKTYGRVPAPAMSHALSDYDSGTGSWTIRCAETGEILARVIDGYAALTVGHEEAPGSQESAVAASVEERGAKSHALKRKNPPRPGGEAGFDLRCREGCRPRQHKHYSGCCPKGQ